MNRTTFKSLAAAAVVLGAFGAATSAHARSDVFFSIGIPATPVYTQPAPVYVRPAPVYVQPAPVYQAPPVYSQAPVYVNPPVYIRYDDRYYRHGRHHGQGHLYGPNGDYDRDGVPNRFDHAPGNPYRR